MFERSAMEPILDHHPDELSNKLVNELFAHEEERLAKMDAQMVANNAEAFGTREPGFIYDGLVYTEENPAEIPSQLQMLHFTLHDTMDIHLEDRQEIDMEKNTIRQILTRFIEMSSTFQDLRDNLPEFLHGILDETKKLQRFNKEAYSLEPGSREEAQYQKYRPRLEFYATTRFLY